MREDANIVGWRPVEKWSEIKIEESENVGSCRAGVIEAVAAIGASS